MRKVRRRLDDEVKCRGFGRYWEITWNKSLLPNNALITVKMETGNGSPETVIKQESLNAMRVSRKRNGELRSADT